MRHYTAVLIATLSGTLVEAAPPPSVADLRDHLALKVGQRYVLAVAVQAAPESANVQAVVTDGRPGPAKVKGLGALWPATSASRS